MRGPINACSHKKEGGGGGDGASPALAVGGVGGVYDNTIDNRRNEHSLARGKGMRRRLHLWFAGRPSSKAAIISARDQDALARQPGGKAAELSARPYRSDPSSPRLDEIIAASACNAPRTCYLSFEMKNYSKRPARYGWIETLLPGESSLIPWSLRISAYNYAKRNGILITIRKEGAKARVIRLKDWFLHCSAMAAWRSIEAITLP